MSSWPHLAVRLTPLLLLPACLPEASRPVGTQHLEERGITQPSMAPAPSAFVAFARPRSMYGDLGEELTEDVFALARAGGGQQQLVSRANRGAGILWDAAGRVYVPTGFTAFPVGQQIASGVQRFDPSGAEHPRAFTDAIESFLSPARRRFYYRSSALGGVVLELDGRERALGGQVEAPRFVGEDLYFISERTLYALGEADTLPVPVVDNVRSWRAVSPAGAPEVVLLAEENAPGTSVLVVRPGPRPARVTRVTSPFDTLAVPMVSADGARVALVEPVGKTPGLVRLRVIRLADGSELSAELPVLDRQIPAGPVLPKPAPDGFPASVSVAFRPGSDDVYAWVNSRQRVLHGDGTVDVLDDRWQGSLGFTDPGGRWSAPTFGPAPDPGLGLFTRDGRHWLYTDAGSQTVRLGDADHLHGTGLPLGRTRDVRQLGEPVPGKLLVWSAPSNSSRWDLRLVDLGTLEWRTLATDAPVVVQGQRRLLARVRRLGGDEAAPADLVLFDLVSGGERELARNVTAFALAPVCPTCDPTAPGVAVAFVVNARVPFDYDGLWTTELP